MNDLRARWDKQETPVKIGIAVGAVIAAIVVVLKVLPALVASMGMGVLLVILFVPYWAPTIIAFARKHPSKGAILALNFFLGWTFVGWVVCLVWALSDNTARGAAPSVVVNTTVSPTMNNIVGAPHVPPPPRHGVGDVINGHRFDGVSWIPVMPAAPPRLPPQHQAGDVVNGHRFDGGAWTPVHEALESSERPLEATP
jgi:hypothetical protein